MGESPSRKKVGRVLTVEGAGSPVDVSPQPTDRTLSRDGREFVLLRNVSMNLHIKHNNGE